MFHRLARWAKRPFLETRRGPGAMVPLANRRSFAGGIGAVASVMSVLNERPLDWPMTPSVRAHDTLNEAYTFVSHLLLIYPVLLDPVSAAHTSSKSSARI